MKFDGWPWKTIGHLFYATSSFVHHFIPIGEFKLELQSGNAQSGSNSKTFRAVWSRNLMDDLQKQKGTSSMLLQALCIISEPLVNSRWSYSPETTNLGQIRRFFRTVWPWNLTDDLEQLKGTSSKQHQAICIISSSYVNSNWSYSPETVKLGCDLCDLDLCPLTLTFCMDLTLVIGNNSWKFHDDMMMGT